MKENKLKSGFTLVELMVFFVFISIILAASTPIITKKVRDIPRRLNHGKYICYRDIDGNLREATYGAVMRISDEPVFQCRFNTPANVSLFKIEMVGGGSGGYDLAERRGDSNGLYAPGSTSVTGDYYLYDGSYSGDISKLPDSILRSAFNNEKIELSVSTGYAGNGGGVKFKPFPPYTATCGISISDGKYYKEDGSGIEEYYQNALGQNVDSDGKVCDPVLSQSCVRNDKDSVKERQAQLTLDIQSDSNLKSPSSMADVNDSSLPRTYIENKHKPYLVKYCSDNFLYYEGQIPHVKSEPNWEWGGGSGGKEKFLYYDYTINIPQEQKDVDIYLRDLVQSYKIGSVPPLSYERDDEQKVQPNPDPSSFLVNEKPAQTRKILPLTYSFEGAGKYFPSNDLGANYVRYDAENVVNFAAIKMPDGSIATNAKRATGGKGSYMYINPETGLISFNSLNKAVDAENGKDADGLLVFSNGNSNPMANGVLLKDSVRTFNYPRLDVSLAVKNVGFLFGNAGKAGEYKVRYDSNLGDGCDITVGQGGILITGDTTNEEIEQSRIAMITRIACNDVNIMDDVSGGNNDVSTNFRILNYFWSLTGYDEEGLPIIPEITPENAKLTNAQSAKDVIKSQEGDPSSLPNLASIFTRYQLPQLGHIGAGGMGPGLQRDTCTQLEGRYSITKIYDGSGSSVQNYPLTPGVYDCETTFEHATSGHGGAVIISW